MTLPGTLSTKRNSLMKNKIFMKTKELIVPKTVQTLKANSKILIQIKLGKCPIRKSTIKMIKNNQE